MVSTVSVDDLRKTFNRNGIMPLCLDQVMDELVKDGIFADMDSFVQPTDGAGLLRRAWNWAVSSVLGTSSPLKPAVFVKVGVVKSKSDAVLEAFDSVHLHRSERIMSRASWEQFLRDHGVSSSEEARVVTAHLCRLGKLTTFTIRDGHVEMVRVRGVEQHDPADLEVDQTIGVVKMTLEGIQAMNEKAFKNIERLRAQASAHAKAKRKVQALAALRQKAAVQAGLDKRAQVETSLLDIVMHVDAAATAKEVLAAYKAGSACLEHMFSSSGVSVESAEDTMEKLQVLLEEGEQIQNVISTGIGADTVSLEDLVAELDLLTVDADGAHTQPVEAAVPVAAPAQATPPVSGAAGESAAAPASTDTPATPAEAAPADSTDTPLPDLPACPTHVPMVKPLPALEGSVPTF